MSIRKTIYNADTIISIEVHNKKPVNYIKWRNAQKSFWNGSWDEGFYIKFMYRDDDNQKLGPHTKEELEEGNVKDHKFIVEGHMVYQQPYVKINFIGEHAYIRYFDTYDMASAWAIQQSKTLTNIITRDYE